MRDQLKSAGVDTDGARLAVAAYDALTKANRNAIYAADAFSEKIAQDNGLLLSLVSASDHRVLVSAIMKMAIPYLQSRVGDMTRGDVPASQSGAESQMQDDRRGKAGGPSRDVSESQQRHDQPARKKQKPVGTKLSRVAAHAVVKSAFDDRLGFDLTVRTARWEDWVNLNKKSGAYTDLTARVVSHPGWSQDAAIRAKQKTPDVMTEEEWKALKGAVWRGRDALGFTNVQL